jgi:hypothetical protein
MNARKEAQMNMNTLPPMFRKMSTVFGIALALLLGVAMPGRAAVIATIDFENIPSLATQPSTFAAAGAMQTYTSPGVFSISGGVVLGNPTFLAAFAAHGTPPNAYGTSDLGDVTLSPTITLALPAAEGVTGVTGVLFNGQLFAENYRITALSGATTIANPIVNVLNTNSSSGFANFSLSSTAAQPITQVTITPTSNIDINGWDFFVDTLTISSGASSIPEPSSMLLVLGGLAGVALGRMRRKL